MALDLNDPRDALAAELAAVLGEATPVTLDPRGLTPPCVLVGVPTTEVANVRTGTLFLPVHVVAPGPGNADAVRWMLTTMGLILEGVTGPFSEARPGPYDSGPNTYPALTAIVSRAIGWC